MNGTRIAKPPSCAPARCWECISTRTPGSSIALRTEPKAPNSTKWQHGESFTTITALQNRNQHKCDNSPFGDECPKGQKKGHEKISHVNVCSNLIHTNAQQKASFACQSMASHT